ncbi:lipoprotein [Phascolarctobacterium faecium]|uniref:Lipoprotein n=11 Tax=Phascolarctobacterium TaxID=33024 RepID=R6IK84_9FIRM|nr:MetQ/NlpA family ABC transporter substrate-binding protein [Phascolarctobacterium faecium]CDB45781.1 lipoprotein [Phascolarctobacterium faecium]
MYIKRHLETTIEKLSGCCKVLLVTGPRQVGKTTLLRRLAEGNRTYVTMDDINVRSLAMTEPGLFLQRYKPPLLIDEIQMAPKLLPYIKMYVDEHGNNGDFWLTGSHAFDLMENVTESLAGRIGIVHLLGFSHAEVVGLGAGAFVPEEKFLLQRAQEAEILPMRDLFEQIWRGSMPALNNASEQDWNNYYSSYVQTFLQRDVRALTRGGDSKPAANSGDKKVVLKVGATPVPHAEILNLIKPQLAKEGVDLQIIEFSDYVKPNLSLADKELDANFFQHTPYLEKFASERNLPLVAYTKVHIEPMGVYSKKLKDLNNVPSGAKVAIPNDPTNGGRALALLQSAKLLKLRDGVGISGTPGDIVDNPKNLQIVEIEAALLPRSMDDVDLSVINSNFAMEAQLNPVKDSLFTEPKDSPYANILAIRKGDDKRPELQKLDKALTSPEVKKFIEEKYKGAVVPAF